MSTPYTSGGESAPGSDLRETTLKTDQSTKPRFVAKTQLAHRTTRYFVDDERLQITVFHWYGGSGAAKAEAVAKALNDLEDK